MSIAQEQATVADESSGLDESAEVDEPAAGRAAKLRESTNNAFEQISGFREALRPPTQKWGPKDCSRIALGHLAGALVTFCLLACSPRPPEAQAPTPSDQETAGEERAASAGDFNQLASGEPESPLPVEADDARLGSETPKVTVVGFLDFQCPYCAEGFDTLTALSRRYADREVRFVFKHLPLESHQLALPAAIAGQAVMQLAGSQAFFEFAELAFQDQQELDFVKLAGWAEEVGVTRASYNEAVGSESLVHRVARDALLAQSLGVSSTPTFFVNGKMVRGAQSQEFLSGEIDAELQAMSEIASRDRAQAYSARVEKNTKESLGRALLEEDPDDYLVPIDGSATQGKSDAPVTIVMFSDYECPYCKRAETTMNQLRERYGSQIRIVFKHHPLPFHESALPSARLAEAVRRKAGDDAFFAVSEELFAQQTPASDSQLRALGRKHGLSTDDLKALSGSNPEIERRIERDAFLADDVQASGTPHFFINGKRLAGARPLAHFAAIIELELERARGLVETGTPQEKVYDVVQKGALQPGAPTRVALPSSVTGPSRGNEDAPVTIHVFSDFQCPFCKRAEDTLAALEERYPGQLRVVWHNLPLDFHDRARPAARAAAEAYRQKGAKGFWQMHDALFGPTGKPAALEREDILRYGKRIGLTQSSLENALDADPEDGSLARDEELAESLGIRGTPAFVIGGYLVTGARELSHFERVVDMALDDSD